MNVYEFEHHGYEATIGADFVCRVAYNGQLHDVRNMADLGNLFPDAPQEVVDFVGFALGSIDFTSDMHVDEQSYSMLEMMLGNPSYEDLTAGLMKR